jgi:glycosyltransferase involved in cell wall biosynthesis
MYNDILKDKLIYYEHGMAWYDRKLDKKNITFLENVNKIICVSSAAKRVLKLKWGIKNKNIVVCLNALRPSCKPANTSIKTLDKNKVINLGIAGRCESFKGFPLGIHAVKELKKRGISSKLFIAGMGKDFESLKKIAKSLSLVDEVNFLGLVNDMKEFYSNIDVFVFPSLRDPFPLVVIEAMAHGCPVIVAGVDGLYEMVKDTGAGSIIKPTLDISYFPEYDGSLDFLKIIGYVYDPYTDSIITPKFVDPTLIADAVEELWNNSTKFEEMSANAIKAVDKKYNYANYMKNIYTTMEDIISK